VRAQGFAAAILVQTVFAAAAAAAQPLPELPPLSREEQLAYVRTAAPAAIVAAATLYVQDEAGLYVEAQKGTNGYSCINQRGTNGKSVIPRCDDRESADALYPTYVLLERMRSERRTVAEYRDTLADGYRTGRFRAPERGSFSYMYSTAAYFVTDAGDRAAFTPHVMVNWPGCRPEDLGVGSTADFRAVHVSLLGVGSEQCHVIINTPPETGIPLAK
jgi:hypothetical protein